MLRPASAAAAVPSNVCIALCIIECWNAVMLFIVNVFAKICGPAANAPPTDNINADIATSDMCFIALSLSFIPMYVHYSIFFMS